MELPVHSLPTLFEQLGLPAEPQDIAAFIASHSPLPDGVKISEASFWTPAQQAFLREGIRDDADWAPYVDQLNVLLHEKKS